ncbi:acetyl-CoA carboxylase biotin carboxyl carrier protein subunit [Enterococcus casseliflavus]|uniref:acetyl-CoA carboxylase biotin carboxyl carrier protein subunit n=1 Tax=Enterococcus casseliflavus TaxID=37734 RepID=UPI0035DD3E48
MLRKFKIAIDGQEYLVEMEEIGAPQPTAPAAVPAQPEAVSTPEPEVAPQPAPATLPADGEPIHSPMPGTILRLLVNVGDTVQENQSLMILEAMKMENEIVAPKAGTVVAIAVNAGDMVNPGELLITIG